MIHAEHTHAFVPKGAFRVGSLARLQLPARCSISPHLTSPRTSPHLTHLPSPQEHRAHRPPQAFTAPPRRLVPVAASLSSPSPGPATTHVTLSLSGDRAGNQRLVVRAEYGLRTKLQELMAARWDGEAWQLLVADAAELDGVLSRIEVSRLLQPVIVCARGNGVQGV